MKNLIYFSAFLDKGILQQLSLLLLSMVLYSKTDIFDILVITSPEFESEIQLMATMYNITIQTLIYKCNTIEEIVMSRLNIFNFPELEQYSRILYLDVDILIQGDLSILFNLELEDKIYGVHEHDLTIESTSHGGDFFDFSSIDKRTPAINAGVLLFNNSQNMKDLFNTILQNYEENKNKYKSIDQQLLNYYSMTMNLLGNETLIWDYVKLVNGLSSTIPISPLKDANIIINHFYAGSAIPKLQRMKYHLEHLLHIYAPPHIVKKDTSDIIEFKQYTWNKGRILFENNNKIITGWGNGNYQCLHDRVYKISWSNISHIVIFLPDFSKYTSVVIGSMQLGHGNEDISLKTTLPGPLVYMDEPILRDNKYLVYCCVFHNMDYFSLLELLFLSIKTFSPDILDKVDFLLFTSANSVERVRDLIVKLNMPIFIKILHLESQHEAGCARLQIFDFDYINNYSKILYLDTDILVQGDIMRVFDCLKEDKVYAVKEYDIYGPGHGGFFFDFKKYNKKTPSLNSGILLFRNSAKTRSVFSSTRKHIDAMKKSGSMMPGCMDQPFIAYNLIQNEHAELEGISKLAFLAEHISPPIDGQIVLSHFVWPIGNVWHKYGRMKDHFKKLFNLLTYSSNFINKIYTWKGGQMQFKGGNVLQTITGLHTFTAIDIMTAELIIDSVTYHFKELDNHAIIINKNTLEYSIEKIVGAI